MMTYEEIMKNTRWVVKFIGHREVCDTETMRRWSNAFEDEIRDIDLSCVQPNCVKDFYDAYWKYIEEHGFTIIKDFYENVYSKEVKQNV